MDSKGARDRDRRHVVKERSTTTALLSVVGAETGWITRREELMF